MQVDSAATSPISARRLSVVIPTFDRPADLAHAIRSVQAQTVHPAEIIVVDNHPQGQGRTVVDALKHDSPVSLRYQHAFERDGVAHARNQGASATTGTWLAFLDDDDKWKPTYLETLESQQHGQIPDLVLTWMTSETPDGQQRPGKRIPEGLGPRAFHARNPGATGSNIVISKHAFEAVGGFDETLTVSEDKDLMIRLLDKGFRYRVQKEPLVLHRTHDGAHLMSDANPRQLAGLQTFLAKHRTHMGLGARLRLTARIHYAESLCTTSARKRLRHRVHAMLLAERRAWRPRRAALAPSSGHRIDERA